MDRHLSFCNTTGTKQVGSIAFKRRGKPTAKWLDLPPTSPGPKPLSGSAQALVPRGTGMLSGGRDVAADPAAVHFPDQALSHIVQARAHGLIHCIGTLGS